LFDKDSFVVTVVQGPQPGVVYTLGANGDIVSL
jgi:hypothetical protein